METEKLHKPVMKEEIVEAFKNRFQENEDFLFLDATFGRGGHYQVLKEVFTKIHYIALDQDLEAVEFAQGFFAEDIQKNTLEVHHCNFSDTEKVESILEGRDLQAVFMDIGVSSPQLDNSRRGFSFYNEGPLDMRMNQSQHLQAKDVLNEYGLEELREIFLTYGEVYAPHKLLNAIEDFRKEKSFETTLEFSNLIVSKLGWRKKGMHPATLYFQALRLYVNKELEALQEALEFYQKSLTTDGIMSVITFHSLEDRIAKHSFKNSVWGKPINKKVIKPKDSEIKSNPRSRSAKLRIFKKEEVSK